jgi:hypothetical protein
MLDISAYDSCTKSGLTDRSTSHVKPLTVGSASRARRTVRCRFNRACHSATHKPGRATRIVGNPGEVLIPPRSSSDPSAVLWPPPAAPLARRTSSPSCAWTSGNEACQSSSPWGNPSPSPATMCQIAGGSSAHTSSTTQRSWT